MSSVDKIHMVLIGLLVLNVVLSIVILAKSSSSRQGFVDNPGFLQARNMKQIDNDFQQQRSSMMD